MPELQGPVVGDRPGDGGCRIGNDRRGSTINRASVGYRIGGLRPARGQQK